MCVNEAHTDSLNALLSLLGNLHFNIFFCTGSQLENRIPNYSLILAVLAAISCILEFHQCREEGYILERVQIQPNGNNKAKQMFKNSQSPLKIFFPFYALIFYAWRYCTLHDREINFEVSLTLPCSRQQLSQTFTSSSIK